MADKDTKNSNDEKLSKKIKSKESADSLPDVLEELPEDVKKVAEIAFSMQRFSGPLPPQLISKVTEEHITKVLDLSEKDDQRAFDDSLSARRYRLLYVIIFCALFIFATIFLVGKDPQLYQEVLKFLAVYAGGLGSGYGLRSYFAKREKK